MSLAVQPESAEVSDVELLHAVARGDEAALARLYDAYRVILFGLLVRILNSREEAEDILQDVFIQVWRRAKDFDEKRGRPFTWLVTLARSRAIDRLRQLGARQRLADRRGSGTDRRQFLMLLSDTIKVGRSERWSGGPWLNSPKSNDTRWCSPILMG